MICMITKKVLDRVISCQFKYINTNLYDSIMLKTLVGYTINSGCLL